MNEIAEAVYQLNKTITELNKPWYLTPEWWAVITALLLGLYGIFREMLYKLINPIKFKLRLLTEAPDSLLIDVSEQSGNVLYRAYYFRLNIINEGKISLNDVEVFLKEAYKFKGSKYEKINSFLPMHLKWANTNNTNQARIQRGLFSHCDLGHIIRTEDVKMYPNIHKKFNESQTILWLDTEATPNTLSNILRPGKYKFTIVVAGSNFVAKEYMIEYSFKDEWSEDEDYMFANIVNISTATP